MINAARNIISEIERPAEWESLVSTPVMEISDYRTLLQFETPWEDLSKHAVEPNVFFEPWMLLPAFKHYASSKERVILVWTLNQSAKPLLIGLIPVSEKLLYRKLPLSHFVTWEYVHCYLGSPLVRKGFEQAFFAKLSRYLETRASINFLEFRMVRQDGPLSRAISVFSKRSSNEVCHTSSNERALLHSTLSPTVYLQKSLTKKRRKEFDRLQRRLSELGKVEVHLASQGDRIEDWIEEFLQLELRGWKGRIGTALSLRQSDREFFTDIVKRAFGNGSLMMLKLTLDGKAIAMQCNLISAEGSFSFKICFDENFARFSPGVLLEIDNLKVILSDPTVRWMDSCAEPGHSMIDRLWNERRIIGNTLFSSNARSSRTLTRLLGFIHQIKRSKLTIRTEENHELPAI